MTKAILYINLCMRWYRLLNYFYKNNKSK